MTSLQTYQKIWSVVQLIPTGKVASYGQIADLAGLPGRARLVGKSMQFIPKEGNNNQPVPWYRVLRSSGQLAFALGSEDFERQKALLMDEGIFLKGRTVSLKLYQWQPSLEQLLFELTN